ncbi:chemotaxis protein CheW [Altererythrobacter arenosus]|uniref:Chemotaxis protein CheW n=1 Tax=Altererythrobacter arenosus TaxID=3032592 RepID=A0ABY8FT70_9SPHN|nr:chemotaxis protein CheW [Altererythrobacter sp. CAU 1644]WFL78180.1 chemotaxis protein CheW [Altererythrobacter sp. CAU 1644]
MNELLLIVHIAGRRCALGANDVHSVIEVGTITPIPRAPEHIAGLTTLRSQALTVVDCRQAIGFDPADFATDIRAPIVHIAGHNYALLVDQVEDVAEAISDAEEVLGGYGERWKGVSKGLIETAEGPALLFDFKALMGSPMEDQRAA